MQLDELLAAITDPDRSIDDIAQLIDAYLPPDKIDENLLLAVRSKLINQDQRFVLRGMLFGARLSPQGVASTWDVYGMWLTRVNPPEIDIELLRVAGWAYRWANDELGRARALINLADGLFVRDKFDEAIQAAQEAQAIFDKKGLTAGSRKTRAVQANSFMELQKPIEAAQFYDEVEIFLNPHNTKSEDAEFFVEMRLSRGFFEEHVRDDFEAARRDYMAAYAALPRTNHHVGGRFRYHFNLALLELRLGRFSEARSNFDQAEVALAEGLNLDLLTKQDEYDLYQGQIVLSLLLDDKLRARHFLVRLDGNSKSLSAKQKAEAARFRALVAPIKQKDSDTSHEEHPITLLDQAIQGFAEVGAQLNQIICLTEKARIAFESKGLLQTAQAALDEARELLTQSENYVRKLELDYIAAQYDPRLSLEQKQEIAENLMQIDRPLEAIAVWSAIGQLHLQRGDRNAARAAYQNALQNAQSARSRVRMTLSALRLQQNWHKDFARAFALADDPFEAWQISERSHAQILIDEINNLGIWRLLERHEQQELRQAYQAYVYQQAKINALEIRSHISKDRSKSEFDANVSSLRAAEQAYFDALERIEASKQRQLGWVTGQIASLTQVQARLKPKTLFVMYSLVPDSDDNELWATLLTHSGAPKKIRLADSMEFRANTKNWYDLSKAWANPKENAALPASEKVNNALADLYLAFIEKLESELAEVEHLIIARDETMDLYPIHAVFDQDNYLIERMSVSYVPSGSALVLLQQRHDQRHQPVRRWFAGWNAQGDAQFPPIKGADENLAQLGRIAHAEVAHGPFTPSTLLEYMSTASLVHLLCHGEFYQDRHPRFAELVIGHQHLLADDLYRADLPVDLLFLDACHSGKVSFGLQGFVGAALVAGASSVISAMWQVEFKESRPIIERFYQYWMSGLTISESLRRAQIEVCTKNPLMWAHFYVTGLADLTYR